MELCIVAIFKNEKHALKEWIDHYLREGVDRFFLVDNGSNDGYDLKGYEDKVEVWINPKKHAQVELTNHYLQKAKKYQWVLVVDLDEFMYSRKPFKTIKDYLKWVKSDISQIKVPWKLFGSSGHIKQPKSIIQGFTRRKKMEEQIIEVKSIVRGKSLLKLEIHFHKTHDKIPIRPDYNPSIEYEFISEKTLKTAFLHLNHYRIQSWDWYSTVKKNRGSANVKVYDKKHTKKYFKQHDTNEVLDTELKRKTRKNIK